MYLEASRVGGAGSSDHYSSESIALKSSNIDPCGVLEREAYRKSHYYITESTPGMCQCPPGCDCSSTMGGMRGVSSLGEVGVTRASAHYASTPHLFVYHPVDDEEDEIQAPSTSSGSSSVSSASTCSNKEPIYSSALDIRKEARQREDVAMKHITEKYDTMCVSSRRDRISSTNSDPLAVTDDDIARIDTFFKGHRTQVWVCRTLANLYAEVNSADAQTTWDLKFMGVPLLLLDSGETKSRCKRQLQLVIAEKGTGFALWQDVIDNLTSYKVQEPHFHTLYLSSDHRRKVGLSFNDSKAALEFHSHLERLTADPANISLSGPHKKKGKKEKTPKYKPPRKSAISFPCNFQHVTNVDATDKTKFFSLQTLSRKKKESAQPHTIVERPKQHEPPAIQV